MVYLCLFHFYLFKFEKLKTQTMLKKISNLGTNLDKKEQQSINGGGPGWTTRCRTAKDCPPWGSYCDNGYCQYF
ncbi:hypothetical protein CXF68_09075 [Tenacibaculum sp. Bg11-29]|nr:hypothetical protein CXF68_09075 [Tenacibaculum sp. Bg11-29]